MVPRPRVTTLDRSWSLDQVQRTIAESVHSRFPVVDGALDNIVGVLHAKHLFRVNPDQPWSDLMVSPLFIPESKPLSDLLQELRYTGQQLAVVLDEFGGVSGVVTLEDALELVVGEIEDEFDQEHPSAVFAVEGGWSVPGYLSLRRLEQILHRTLEQPQGIDSLGGLASSLLAEQATKPGASFQWNGLDVQVVETDNGIATRLLVYIAGAR
jgi:magnesium and cobalt transporter